MEPKDYLCVALDMDDRNRILDLVHELKGHVGFFKLNSAFTRFGPGLVEDIKEIGGKVFLDLKFHDIPNTVASYAKACAELGVDMFNVHAAGGMEMMKAAAVNAGSARVIAVTVMTSISQQGMNREMNIAGKVEDQVHRWAKLSSEAGLHGIVCSAADLHAFRDELPKDFMYVTPGVRPAGADHQDQKRVFTPSKAINSGSSLLVVGRAILGADDRVAAAKAIVDEIASALH